MRTGLQIYVNWALAAERFGYVICKGSMDRPVVAESRTAAVA